VEELVNEGFSRRGDASSLPSVHGPSTALIFTPGSERPRHQTHKNTDQMPAQVLASGAGAVAQLLSVCLSMYKALGSIPNTAEKK
jgi:hypothetical protein